MLENNAKEQCLSTGDKLSQGRHLPKEKDFQYESLSKKLQYQFHNNFKKPEAIITTVSPKRRSLEVIGKYILSAYILRKLEREFSQQDIESEYIEKIAQRLLDYSTLLKLSKNNLRLYENIILPPGTTLDDEKIINTLMAAIGGIFENNTVDPKLPQVIENLWCSFFQKECAKQNIIPKSGSTVSLQIETKKIPESKGSYRKRQAEIIIKNMDSILQHSEDKSVILNVFLLELQKVTLDYPGTDTGVICASVYDHFRTQLTQDILDKIELFTIDVDDALENTGSKRYLQEVCPSELFLTCDDGFTNQLF